MGLRTRLPFLILFAGIIWSCSPYYETERAATGRRPYLVEVIMASEDLSKGSVLLIETHSLEDCRSGGERAEVVAKILLEPNEFVMSAGSIRCQSVEPVPPPKLRSILAGAGYRSPQAIVPPPVRPLLHNWPLLDNWVNSAVCLYYDVLSTGYLSYSDVSVQIVIGYYGNREGTEEEHTYSVSEKDGRLWAKTIRFVSRRVKYDRLPEY